MNVSAAMLIRLIGNFFILLILKGCGKLKHAISEAAL
jgi:hypothetical protein